MVKASPCVSFAAMNDLDPKLVSEVVEVQGFGIVRDFPGLRSAEFLVREGLLRDVQQCMFGEMADQAGVRAAFDHGCWARLFPLGDHAPQLHYGASRGCAR